MKKYRYAFAIVIGLATGTLVLINSGDKANALGTMLLSGVLVTLVTSLSANQLQTAFASANRQTNSLRSKLGINQEVTSAWKELIRMEPSRLRRIMIRLIPIWVPIFLAVFYAILAVGIVLGVMIWSIYRFLLTPLYRLPVRFVKNQRFRKEVYYSLTLLGLAYLAACSVWGPAKTLYYFDISYAGWIVNCSLFVSWFTLAAMFVIAGVAVFWAVIALVHDFFVVSISKNPDKWLAEKSKLTTATFWETWYIYGSIDNRPPLQSVLYMLKIRGLNVLIVCIGRPIQIFLWILYTALLGKKSGLSATVTAILLVIQYWSTVTMGWFATYSLNYWLMVSVLTIVGIAIGRKIYDLQLLPDLEFPWLFEEIYHQALPAKN